MNTLSDSLRQRLAELTTLHTELQSQLDEVLHAFNNYGTPLALPLLEELHQYSLAFAALQEVLWNTTVGADADVAQSHVHLDSLDALARQVDFIAQSFNSQKALQILQSMLTLRHRERVDFPGLHTCHLQASELAARIQAALPALHEDAQALLQRSHPLAALLQLIELRDDADEEQIWVLQKCVADAFGVPLAIAAVRGQLVPGPPLPPLPSNPEQPLDPLTGSQDELWQTDLAEQDSAVAVPEPTSASTKPALYAPGGRSPYGPAGTRRGRDPR